MYCPRCNNELTDGSSFCRFCGESLDQRANTNEEQEFLDATHRLLRWERKAWSIAGKAFLIFGIIFAGLFSMISFIGMAAAEDAFFTVFMIYAIYGGLFIAIGAVNLAICSKITQYMDSMYSDFQPTHERCNSIGLIVLSYFFNNIAMVFFIINFVRMKTSKNVINRILSRQSRQLPPY